MTFSLLVPYIVACGLIFVRCGAMLGMIPMLGGEMVPKRMRGAVAFVIAVTLTPLVGALPFPGVGQLLLAAAGELLLGLAMGLVLRLVLLAAEIAGEVAGMQMGFAFNRVADPLTKEPVAVTSRLMSALAMLLLVVTDGHHVMLQGLGASLQQAPVGEVLPSGSYIAPLVRLLSTAVSAGLRIAAPVVVALLVTNAALGLLSRAAPQLNLFIFAFGLSIAIGMLILTTSAGPSMSLMVDRFRDLPQFLSIVAGG